MSKLTYIRCGDYDIPNLKLSEQPETSIGKYGRMRKSYLKEHRPILYNHMYYWMNFSSCRTMGIIEHLPFYFIGCISLLIVGGLIMIRKEIK